jgi:hypothetical protein
MKQKITLTIDKETHQFLKEEAKRRNVTIKQVGEEYFYLMVAEGEAKRLNKLN